MADRSGYEPMERLERTKIIAGLLKVLREEQGLTMGDIEQRLHIKKSTYAEYEAGRSQPNIETLIRFAYFYNVSMDYITGKTMAGRDGLFGDYDAKAWLQNIRADDFKENNQKIEDMIHALNTIAYLLAKLNERLENSPDAKALIEEYMEQIQAQTETFIS